METTANGWTIVDHDAGVLACDYSFGSGGQANTFVARFAEGKLLVVSPCVGLTDGMAADLAAYGEVVAVMANNGFHHLGVAEWRTRYPNARFFAAPLAARRIAKQNAHAGSFEPLDALVPLLGDNVGVRDVQNTKCGESWTWAKAGDGYALYTSDVLANIPKLPNNFLMRNVFKWTKSAPGFCVFNLALQFIVKDKKATLRTMLEDVKAHPPTVLVPAHGDLLASTDLPAQTEALLSAHC